MRLPRAAAAAAVVAFLGASVLAVTASTGERLGGDTSPAAGLAGPIIERQDFEGAAFPPAGWSVVDVAANTDGVPPRFVFSRQTCMVEPGMGGIAAAWSVGGGSLGDDLPCGSPYPGGTPIDSRLVYRMDTTSLPGGIRANMRFRVDQPDLISFRLCASTGDPNEPYDCVHADALQQSWSEFAEPIAFPRAAGQTDAELVIAYADPSPSGSHVGLVVDNVVIEGLLTPTVTPTATVAPSRSPSPTPTQTPTAAGSATATEPVEVEPIYVPIAHRGD